MAQTVRSVPPLPQTERGSFCHLAADAQGERVVYTNGTNVLWRSVAAMQAGTEKPEDTFCWKGHTKRTTAAAMAPNGQWVVSGDITGAVRVWGAKGDHVQKNEYKLWDGIVKDVAWSGDSTRIMACGDGKEVRAVAMIWDTGSKTGEVAGHTKQINSIAFRSQRPFRIATGSEDMTVVMHQGPPFKYVRSHQLHSNFVNSVRYSPDGEWFCSAGSDTKLHLYEGKEGELVKEFAKPDGASGSFWASAWSPDSARIVTAGGDKKIRVWDREAGAQVSVASVGKGALEDMQVGIAWTAPTRIVSICLDGRLLLWDVAADGGLTLVAEVDGTQGPLSCLACDGTSGIIAQGGSDGVVAVTKPDGQPKRVKVGKGVTHILAHSPGYKGPPEAWVSSLDDCIRQLSLESIEFVGEPKAIKEFVIGMGWLDPAETKLVVATGKNNLQCVSGAGVEWTRSDALSRRPTAMASLPGAPGKLAVSLEKPEGSMGGVQSHQFDILLFSIEDAGSPAGLVQKDVLRAHLGEVSTMKFSPSGEFLASADAGNKIIVWNLASSPAAVMIDTWASHTARVTSVDWLPSGRHVVSGSLDRHLYVWDVDNPTKRVQVTEAHKGGVSAVATCGDGLFASAGQDGFMLVHKLS